MKIGAKIIILLTLMSLFQTSALSQEIITSLKSDIIPPDPASAVFKKYMSPQPALSTGAITVNAPLYDLNYKGIRIPFSLSYMTNGIHVYSDPQPCGYGWAFLPGLRITRTIMGRPDERFDRVYNHDIWEYGKLSHLSEYTFYKRCIAPINSTIKDEDLYDTQHDIFSFNIISGSYTFISDFTTDGEVKFIGVNDNNLKITASLDLSTINVIDDNGIEYEFEVGEVLSSMDNYPTAWVLKTIILTNGEKIDFEWIKRGHTKASGYEFSATVIKDSFNPYRKDPIPDKSASNLSNNQVEIEDGTDAGNLIPYGRSDKLAHLSKVTFPGGSINLNYTSNPIFLTSLTVFNSLHEQVKEIQLSYHESSGNCLLKSIEISDEGKYSFGYNPNRFVWKYAQDYWGFYNGQTSNISLIPKLNFKVYTSSFANDTIEGSTLFQEFGYANRCVDEQMMQANILTSVTYPTGGQTQFEYEAHRFNGHDMIASSEINHGQTPRLTIGGGLRVKRTISTAGDGSTPIIRTYEYGINGNGLANCIAEPTLETFIDVYDSFEPSPSYAEGTFACFYRLIYLNSASKYLRNYMNETPIWYNQVTEYCNNAKIIYKFDQILDSTRVTKYGLWKEYPWILNKIFSKGPLLVEKQEFRKTLSGYELLCKTIHEYEKYTNPLLRFDNSHISREIVAHDGCFPSAPDYEYNESDNTVFGECVAIKQVRLEYSNPIFYDCNSFSIYLSSERLKRKLIINYINGDSVKNETNYNYHPNYNLISKQSIKTSDGKERIIEYLYPCSHLSQENAEQRSVLSKMYSKNIIGNPYRIITKSGLATTIQEKHYGFYGNNLYLPCKEILKRGNDSITAKVYDYDIYGNVQSVTFFNNNKETYLWGYNGQYPVFYINGLNFDEVKSIVGDEFINSISNSNLENVRPTLSTLIDGKAQLTSYQYKPLVGISQITDIAKNNFRYHYDYNNRLAEISLSGEGTQQRFAYNLFDENFKAEISSNDEYDIGDNIYAKCQVEHASAMVSYKWHISDSTGYDITPNDSINPDVSMKINYIGNIAISCVATDLLKNTSSTITKIVYVNPETIKLSNKSGDNTDHFTATISCLNPITARFRIMPTIYTGHCTITIGTHTEQIQAQTPDKYLNVSLTPKTHDISIKMSDDTKGELIFYLCGVTGNKKETYTTDAVIITK